MVSVVRSVVFIVVTISIVVFTVCAVVPCTVSEVVAMSEVCAVSVVLSPVV